MPNNTQAANFLSLEHEIALKKLERDFYVYLAEELEKIHDSSEISAIENSLIQKP